MSRTTTEAIDLYALKHTVNVVKGALADDPDDAIRTAYTILGTQKLSKTETAEVVAATLGNVLGILRELVPEGTARQRLTARIEAVGSYAALLEVVNQIGGPPNRAARRKKGRKK